MSAYVTWDISPEIFEGFLWFRWYGLCWVVGILLAFQITRSIYRVEGVPVATLDKLTTYVLLGVIIGARLGHVLFYDPWYYLNNPIEVLPIRISPTFQFTGLAGLASHGGILGALIALYLYSRRFQENFLLTLDRLIVGGALLGCFIRVGNLINSEIIGTPSQLPWAFIFSRIDQTPRHPAQLYEALFYLILSVLLFLVWQSGKVRQCRGFLSGLGIFLIFLQRFLIEFLKENQVLFEENLTLNMGQMLSIPLIIGGVVLMIWSRRKFAVNKG